MKNKELVINVYDENGPDVQDVILEAFEKYLEKKVKKNNYVYTSWWL